MRGILFRTGPDLAEFSARPHAWKRLSRCEAVRHCGFRPVAVLNPVSPTSLEWLGPDHVSMKGRGPYRLDAFRYYLPLESAPLSRSSGGASRTAPKSAGGQGEPQPEPQAVELLPEPELQHLPKKERLYKWRVRLDIDPKGEEHNDDTFTLTGMDSGKAFTQVRTVSNDQKPGDDFLDLEYTDLKDGVKYTLEIDEGKETGKYRLFENLSYAQMRMLSPSGK